MKGNPHNDKLAMFRAVVVAGILAEMFPINRMS